MRLHVFLLVVLLGFPIFFTAETDAADSEGGAVGGVIIAVWNNLEFVRTDADGAFSVPVSMGGKVTDAAILQNPLAGVAVSIPYDDQEFTGGTDDAGAFTTNTVSFEGTVVNEADEPIADAWVSVQAKPPLTDTTDMDGAFTGGTLDVGSPYPFRRLNQEGALLRGNRLTVALSAKQTITVSFFTIAGRQVFSRSVDDLSDRVRSIELPELSGGFYLLKVTAGTFTATFKRVFFSKQALLVQRNEVRADRSATTAKIKSAGAVVPDTLVAFADGYLAAYCAVDAATTSGLTIKLTASKQWKPADSQELERQGGMVKIKANGHDFSMGQPVMLTEDFSQNLWELEKPVHTVSFTYDFWMDTTEVTQKQYEEVMTAGYSNYKKSGWKSTYGLGDNIPAYFLSYGDAVLYCNARSKADSLDTVYSFTGNAGDPGEMIELQGLVSDFSKNGYRLPTEAEWEYACRGGTVTDFYWNKNYRPYPATAEDTTEITAHVLWGPRNNVNTSDPNFGVKEGAATKTPNSYGLYDMLGSLSEWTQAGEVLFTGEAVADSKPTTSPGDTLFVLRGGNWSNNASFIRSSCRSTSFGNYSYFVQGFRTVKEVR